MGPGPGVFPIKLSEALVRDSVAGIHGLVLLPEPLERHAGALHLRVDMGPVGIPLVFHIRQAVQQTDLLCVAQRRHAGPGQMFLGGDAADPAHGGLGDANRAGNLPVAVRMQAATR